MADKYIGVLLKNIKLRNAILYLSYINLRFEKSEILPATKSLKMTLLDPFIAKIKIALHYRSKLNDIRQKKQIHDVMFLAKQ